MNTNYYDTNHFWTNNKGFSLIELAVVLIIIGIIIGAVVKGRDLMRGGEQKKLYTQFISAWKTAYLNFYDRTGRILGDTDNDRKADTNPSHRGNPPTDTGRDALVNGDTVHNPPKYYGLSQVGLKPPSTNTDKAWRYRYTDSTGKAHELTMAFDYDVKGRYNYLRISDIPNELCIALDTMIDGSADGVKGDLIGDKVDGTAWGGIPSDSTTARWKMGI